MTTTDLVKLLAKRLKITQKQAKWLLQAHFALIAEHIAQGQRVVLRGFGAFETRQTRSRRMQLPGGAEKVFIPSKTVATFRPAQRLKDDSKIWRPPS